MYFTIHTLYLSEQRRIKYLSQVYLTVFIVVILIFGMLMIAADMQRHLLNPRERMTKIIKIITGRHWKKKIQRLRESRLRAGKGGKPQEDDEQHA